MIVANTQHTHQSCCSVVAANTLHTPTPIALLYDCSQHPAHTPIMLFHGCSQHPAHTPIMLFRGCSQHPAHTYTHQSYCSMVVANTKHIHQSCCSVVAANTQHTHQSCCSVVVANTPHTPTYTNRIVPWLQPTPSTHTNHVVLWLLPTPRTHLHTPIVLFHGCSQHPAHTPIMLFRGCSQHPAHTYTHQSYCSMVVANTQHTHQSCCSVVAANTQHTHQSCCSVVVANTRTHPHTHQSCCSVVVANTQHTPTHTNRIAPWLLPAPRTHLHTPIVLFHGCYQHPAHTYTHQSYCSMVVANTRYTPTLTNRIAPWLLPAPGTHLHTPIVLFRGCCQHPAHTYTHQSYCSMVVSSTRHTPTHTNRIAPWLLPAPGTHLHTPIVLFCGCCQHPAHTYTHQSYCSMVVTSTRHTPTHTNRIVPWLLPTPGTHLHTPIVLLHGCYQHPAHTYTHQSYCSVVVANTRHIPTHTNRIAPWLLPTPGTHLHTPIGLLHGCYQHPAHTNRIVPWLLSTPGTHLHTPIVLLHGCYQHPAHTYTHQSYCSMVVTSTRHTPTHTNRIVPWLLPTPGTHLHTPIVLLHGCSQHLAHTYTHQSYCSMVVASTRHTHKSQCLQRLLMIKTSVYQPVYPCVTLKINEMFQGTPKQKIIHHALILSSS